MEEIMKKIREDLKKVNTNQIVMPFKNANTMFVETKPDTPSIMAQKMKKIRQDLKTPIRMRISPTKGLEPLKTQVFEPKPSEREPDRMMEIMKKIREGLKTNKEMEKSAMQPKLRTNIPVFEEDKINPNIPTSQFPVFPTELSSEPESMEDIMKKIREELKNLNKEPSSITNVSS